MYLVLVAHLIFPEAARTSGPARPAFELRRVVSVKIESSWRNLTTTAVIELPGRWIFKERQVSIKDWVQRGDRVRISLGYNQTLAEEFVGYVTDVSPRIPITLTCEDEMYQLKKRPAKFSYASVRLPKLLHDICPAGTQINALDVDLGHFRAKSTTVAKVLEKLKSDYGFVSYFQSGVLYCGKVYQKGKPATTTTFSFQRDVLSDQLEYRDRDDLKVRVKATSHLATGKKLSVVVGDVNDPDAEERTLQYFDIKTEAGLRALAMLDVPKLKVTGYKGSFTTYGLPSMRHGQIAALVSSEYPERNGDFFIDAVTKTFHAGGYRQEITLGSGASFYGLAS